LGEIKETLQYQIIFLPDAAVKTLPPARVDSTCPVTVRGLWCGWSLHESPLGTVVMPWQTTCPTCKRLLDVPDGFEDRPLICPGCRSKVAHPGRQTAIQAATGNITVQKPSSSQIASIARTCPSCGERLLDQQRDCLGCGRSCEEALRPLKRLEVGCGAIALAMAGLCGLFLALIGLLAAGSMQGWLLALMFMTLLTPIAMAIASNELPHYAPTQMKAATLFVRTLAVFGFLFVFVASIGILFFAICTGILLTRRFRS
jgi:hypothetical protein